MLATSTHDTKRSEDVRARLTVLSEIPDKWSATVSRWSARNRHHRRAGAPPPYLEWLYYQTLVGAWPIDAGPAAAYLEKAAKEARRENSWGGAAAAVFDGVLGAGHCVYRSPVGAAVTVPSSAVCQRTWFCSWI